MIGVGLLVDTLATGSTYQTQLTINYKFDSSNASNGDINWDRYPLELIQFYNTEQWRFGAGISYHLAPTISSSGFASGYDVDFDDALGLVVEVDYLFDDQGFVGGRLVSIEYEGTNGGTLDGTSIGLIGGVHF